MAANASTSVTTTVETVVEVTLSESDLEQLLVEKVKQAYPNFDSYEFGYDVSLSTIRSVSVTCRKVDVKVTGGAKS